MTREDTEPEACARPVTDAEAAHYQCHGWVKLDGLLTSEVVEQLLGRATRRLGRGAKVPRASDQAATSRSAFERWDACSSEDQWICALSHSPSLAALASRLMGDQVRFYYDTVFVKQPARADGRETPWHQDLPQHPLDRAGMLNIWIALVDCPARKGTIRFLSGSHRAGSLGRHLRRSDGVDLLQEHPWLAERYDISPPLHLHAGDATVHDLAIAHCAPENTTDSARWAYITQWIPASARYTGAANRRTDGLGLQVGEPLEHPNFPVIEI
jgi:ectoine hydroxylase-related dioxygenase (phytanoyl-CoA dioxygenase family)